MDLIKNTNLLKKIMKLSKAYSNILSYFKHRWYGFIVIDIVKYLSSRDLFNTKLKILNKGSIKINKYVIGGGNLLIINKNACLYKVSLKIQGSNNTIIIGENTVIGKDCRLYLFGNNLKLEIGRNCTFTHDDEILVQEDNSSIKIGDDCMFSHHINVRTSDAHPIYDQVTGNRSNTAKNIIIGNHVWVTAHAIIQKGCQIGNHCVVGTHSIVNSQSCINKETGVLISNAIVAGIPAKIVKTGIEWKRNFEK